MIDGVTGWRPPVPLLARAPRQGFIGRALNRPHLPGFVAAVERELLERGMASFDEATRERLLSTFNVPLAKAREPVSKLVDKYAAGLSERDFRAGVVDQLRVFGGLFGVPVADLDGRLARQAEQVFSEAAAEAAQDRIVTEAEAESLVDLSKLLNLSAEARERFYGSAVRPLVEEKIKAILADGMLSPDEDAELTATFKDLHVVPELAPSAEAAFENGRRAWAIANDPLPVIDAPVNLQRGEVAYAAVVAEVFEQRSRTVAISYAGPSFRVRIAKGLYYRAGHARVARDTETYQQRLGKGPLVVTNKRLIFAGDERAFAARLDSILDIDTYSDGVTIQRSAGKPKTYVFDEEDRWFNAILARAIAEACH